MLGVFGEYKRTSSGKPALKYNAWTYFYMSALKLTLDYSGETFRLITSL